MERHGKGHGTMMVCGSLFLSNSILMLVVELHSLYLLCAGAFLQLGRTGCAWELGGSQPGPLSLPEALPKETFH